MRQAMQAKGTPPMSEHRTSTGNPTIDELDKKIICALQGDFPLVAEPYKAMAEQIGVSVAVEAEESN